MATVYGDIAKAVRKKYDDTAALNALTATTGSCWHNEAPPNSDMIYITFDIISIIPTYTLNDIATPRENVRVSFSIFSDTLSPSAVYNTMDKLEAAYGEAGSGLVFTGATYTQIDSIVESVNLDRNDGVWHALMDYQMMFEKAA